MTFKEKGRFLGDDTHFFKRRFLEKRNTFPGKKHCASSKNNKLPQLLSHCPLLLWSVPLVFWSVWSSDPEASCPRFKDI